MKNIAWRLPVVLFAACWASAAGGVERDVTVKSGSLENPIGVGFGHWEELEPLTIHLYADPGEISHAEPYAPEETIWVSLDNSQPDPWTFQTTAIYPDEAFAVIFKGTILAPGPGSGPNEFAVAVSEIDIDVDSLNSSTEPYRAPVPDDAEADQAEYFPSFEQQTGMVMSASEGWAMIKIRADIKRPSKLRLNADEFGMSSFDFADSAFSALSIVDTDGTDKVLFEQSVQPNDGPWTFYVKPNADAVHGGGVSISAVLVPLGQSQLPPDERRAVDQVFVAVQNNGDIEKVEFVPKDDLDLENNQDADKYGKLEKGKNPDGNLEDEQNKHRHQLIEPAYLGGDRFFPDADHTSVNTGRNIVRVRAHVTNMNVGDTVLFRSFDVDDPSDEQYDSTAHRQVIDDNRLAGKDNRGTLSGGTPTKRHQAGTSRSTNRGGWDGRLRSVNVNDEGDEEFSVWQAEGKIVSAKVKQVIIGEDEKLVAEADLLTTFAPGDNFRVIAVPVRLRNAIEGAHVDAPIGKASHDNLRVTTDKTSKYFSPQLAVWRYLHVENDATVPLYSLMTPSGASVVRQTNRFADAFLEPNYDVLNADTVNTSNPTGPVPGQDGLRIHGVPSNANDPPEGTVHKDDVAIINAARQSKSLESRQFWAVYVTDVYPKGNFPAPTPGVLGVTFNKHVEPDSSSWEVAAVFMGTITTTFPAEDVATVAERVTIHEVAHQMLQPGGPQADDNGHRIPLFDQDAMDAYEALDEGDQVDSANMDNLNIIPNYSPTRWNVNETIA